MKKGMNEMLKVTRLKERRAFNDINLSYLKPCIQVFLYIAHKTHFLIQGSKMSTWQCSEDMIGSGASLPADELIHSLRCRGFGPLPPPSTGFQQTIKTEGLSWQLSFPNALSSSKLSVGKMRNICRVQENA